MAERADIETVPTRGAALSAVRRKTKGTAAASALAFAAALWAPWTCAQTPSDADIAKVQALFGFTPSVTRRVIQGGFDRQPEFSRYSQTQRTCFVDALQADVEGELRESFKTLFVDAETVSAWLRFGRTAGGDRFTGLLRAAVDAKLDGNAAPNPLAAVADMSDAERSDVMAFMETPAAAVLKRDFPEMKIPAAAAERAAQRCGIDLSEGRT